ncbi:MAG: penicillin-binding protein 2 [Victivallaceae bacterium]
MLNKRILFVALSLVFLFSLLIVRYFQIQVLEGDRWESEALLQHRTTIKEPFKRGTFFSNSSLKRNSNEEPRSLVVDVTKFHLCLDALMLPERFRDETVLRLVELSGSKTFAELRPEFDKRSRFRKLIRWIDPVTKDRILEWWKPYAVKRKIPLNAIFFVKDYKRSYPFGKLLGQVLHTIRENKDDKTLEAFPTGGLEARFNDILKGCLGERQLLRSPLNRLDADILIKPPQDGADVYLTIDHCIQNIVEEELEKGVLKCMAKGGRAVLMDPYTGEILALAQYPFFDPTFYKDFFNDPEKIEYTKVSSVTDAFEPGSVMKPITMAIALKANEELTNSNRIPFFNEEQAIDVTRTLFPGRKAFPLKDISSNKKLNMYMAIQKSSNVYMAQIIDMLINVLDCKWYRAMLTEFGFGKKTGIELPGETMGFVPSLNGFYKNGSPEWSISTPYSLAIGYNILATNLQIAAAYASIANGGFLIKPTLIKKIVFFDNGKPVIMENVVRDRGSFKRIVSRDIARTVMKAMTYTTLPGGTAVTAGLDKYTTAGKTGTTEKIVDGKYCKKKHITSFVGMAPADLNFSNPVRFVLMVSIDEPAYVIREDGTKNYMSGRSSAVVFGSIAEKVLSYLGVVPDKNATVLNEDVRVLKQLYEEWNH